MIKKFGLLTAIILLSFSSFSQPRGSLRANITLSVRDSLTDAPLELVTAVLSKIDKNHKKEIFTYAISDSSGNIKFNRIPASDYEISLQYMGYFMKIVPVKIDVKELIEGNNKFDLGVIKLRENVVELNAVTIREHVAPIKYLGDTIQYNAAAFKLTDTDVLEDFFKKLPGWSVDRDGKITANGKVIEQITVNGRIFFLNDPVFVSRNLPAKLLKNIKLFEKQSERSTFTGIDDGARTNTVDVTIKEDMLNGWVGSIKAGGGTDKRYKTNDFIANFNKYNQIAIVGNASNLNEAPMMPGVAVSSGLSRNYSIGSNINLSNKKNNFEADISYKLNDKSIFNDNEVHRTNFLKDSIFVYDKSSRSDNSNINHLLSGQINWSGKKSKISINPKVMMVYGNYSDSVKYRTIGGFSGVTINEGESVNSGRRSIENFSTDIQYITKTGKSMRTFSIKGTVGIDKRESEGKNKILNRSDQQYFTDDKSFDVSAKVSYTEPITKKIIFGSNYSIASSIYSQSKETYNSDNNGNYSELDSLLSANSNNIELTQNIEFYLQKPKRKDEVSYFMLGASILPSYLKRDSHQQEFDKWFWNISPNAEYRLTTKDFLSIFLKYSGNVRTPSLTLMMPIPDNTNPLLIRLGNSELKSEYEHNVNLSIRKITSLSGGFGYGILLTTKASYFKNRILNKSWFDEDGIQYTMPINYSGDYFITSNLHWEQPFFKGVLTIANIINGGLYNNNSFVNGEKNTTKRNVLGESLNLTLKLDKIYFQTKATFNYELSVNSIFPEKKTKTWRNVIEGYISYSMPFDITFKSDIAYQYFKGYTAQYDKPYLLWNAAISRPLIKNKLTISFSANDILNQNKNIQREVTDFYIQETRYNTVRQYFLFSLTYKFLIGGKTGAFKERANSVIRSNETITY
ncbi:MAG: outer membrane beta-barrel protein [Bacteroidales bacterium]|jgi:hypothetical protein|nr:outer membrane beta-barrel protein [Bacteroidales bacterium]